MYTSSSGTGKSPRHARIAGKTNASAAPSVAAIAIARPRLSPRRARLIPSSVPIAEDDDKAYWGEVEEATELLAEERFRDALAALRDVAKRSPKNHYAYYFSAIALFEIGELAPARDAYRACLALAPAHLGARVALSHVLRQLGDAKGAIQEGARALSQSPGDAEALHAVGLAYLERGDETAAKKYLEAFLDTKPELEVAVEVRAILAQISPKNEKSGREN